MKFNNLRPLFIYASLNDAVMQAGLFFWAGTVIHLYGVRTIEDLVRLHGAPGWMSAVLVVMAMSMIGIPPTGGFFGKWYIILGAVEARNYFAIGAVLIATLLTLAYFVKLFEQVFRERSGHHAAPMPEAPLGVRISLGAASVAIILLGLMSDQVVGFLLKAVVPPGL